MSSLRSSRRATLLPIRLLRIATDTGNTVELRSVRCPAEGRAVPLEECLSCTEGAGIVQDPAGAEEYVSCKHVETVEITSMRSARETLVGQVMTTDVLAVRPEVDVELVTDLLFRRGVGGAPVVDAEGHPKGIVSKTDLLGNTAPTSVAADVPRPARRRVADAMTHGAYTISENASVAQAAALLAVHGVHRVPVVSDDGKVAGILTDSDIVRWLAQQAGELASRRREPHGGSTS